MRASCFENAFITHLARKIELEAASYDQYLALNVIFGIFKLFGHQCCVYLITRSIDFKFVLVNIIANILTY